MMNAQSYYPLIYLIPIFAAVIIYLRHRHQAEKLHAKTLNESVQAGLTEPPSLHPVINTSRCIGSASCLNVCPEGAIGIIGGKAILTNPSACIGHGACFAACPVDAITLVFGTERRGIDIPDVHPNFESNVPGLFIAGELGGMGLIRKAAEQGRQAIESISRMKHSIADHDVIIIGCGPAGISAGLGAIEKQLRYVVLEQESSLGGAIFQYPRNKVAMTAPVNLPLVGKMIFTEVSKEKLLDFWKNVVERTELKINYHERMESIRRENGIFIVQSTKNTYHSRAVLLAIGRRGTPRKLEVPGEEHPKVTYRVSDPEQYAGQKVLVVGGGDSAVEAAIACAEFAEEVSLSYRSEAFSRLKGKNRDRLDVLYKAGRIRVLLSSSVTSISTDKVELQHNNSPITLANDAVIVSIGGMLSIDLLKSMGIHFETQYGKVPR